LLKVWPIAKPAACSAAIADCSLFAAEPAEEITS
jgi:hypothetical protein